MGPCEDEPCEVVCELVPPAPTSSALIGVGLDWALEQRLETPTWWAECLSTSETVSEQCAIRKVLTRVDADVQKWNSLPPPICLAAELLEQGLWTFPSLVTNDMCLTPSRDFRAGEIMMKLGGKLHRWDRFDGKIAGSSLGLRIRKKGGDGIALTLMMTMSKERHAAPRLHVAEEARKASQHVSIQYLTPEWQFSSVENPTLTLKAASFIPAWSCELGVCLEKMEGGRQVQGLGPPQGKQTYCL